MQKSYGEERLEVDGFSSGTVRVLGIYSDSALYPRLVIRLGWSLREIPPSDGPFRTEGLRDYQIVNVTGELRLGYGGGSAPLVGRLWPTQGTIEIRSSQYHSEDQIQLACDLDLNRLEKIEEHRNGQPARFSLILWPVITRTGQRVRTQMHSLAFEIPRDEWLEFLSKVRYGEYELLEIKRLTHELDVFADVKEQLQVARERINRGEYNSAVSAVRTALERAIQQARPGNPPLKELLSAKTDATRGAAYAGIVTQVKELGNRAVHKPDASVNFSRAEALFILRTAESAIALLGQLLPPPEGEQAPS